MEDKQAQALDMALSQIEKNYGKGAIMRLGEHGNVGVAAIPTGALALDIALGIGGYPRGRIVEVYGPDAVEVEFVRASGRTQALVTLPPSAVRDVGDDDLVAVRPATSRDV